MFLLSCLLIADDFDSIVDLAMDAKCEDDQTQELRPISAHRITQVSMGGATHGENREKRRSGKEGIGKVALKGEEKRQEGKRKRERERSKSERKKK